jgi:hypothetical protein
MKSVDLVHPEGFVARRLVVFAGILIAYTCLWVATATAVAGPAGPWGLAMRGAGGSGCVQQARARRAACCRPWRKQALAAAPRKAPIVASLTACKPCDASPPRRYLNRGTLTYSAPTMVADPLLGLTKTDIGAMTSAFPAAYGGGLRMPRGPPLLRQALETVRGHACCCGVHPAAATAAACPTSAILPQHRHQQVCWRHAGRCLFPHQDAGVRPDGHLCGQHHVWCARSCLLLPPLCPRRICEDAASPAVHSLFAPTKQALVPAFGTGPGSGPSTARCRASARPPAPCSSPAGSQPRSAAVSHGSRGGDAAARRNGTCSTSSPSCRRAPAACNCSLTRRTPSPRSVLGPLEHLHQPRRLPLPHHRCAPLPRERAPLSAAPLNTLLAAQAVAARGALLGAVCSAQPSQPNPARCTPAPQSVPSPPISAGSGACGRPARLAS